MVSYPADKFIPGVTPTQKDLAMRGQLAAVIDGTPAPWFDITWAVDVDAAAALVNVFEGGPQFDSAEPNSAEAVTATLGPLGLYFSAAQPLPEGTVTELRLTGDAEATVTLEAQ